MHTIDPQWTDLAAGYRAAQSLQAKLEAEFGRAVQAGKKHKFRRELTAWQKKRRVFLVMAVIAPLSIITLCVAAFYLREVACVIVYWTLLVGIILVTLAVAGRNYIREVMNRPRPESQKTLPLDLEQRWWASLAPREIAVSNDHGNEPADLLAVLGRSLPADCLAARSPTPLLISPAGLWLFQPVSWSGTVIRQAGSWKQVQTVQDKAGRKQLQVQMPQAVPDQEWLQRKGELEKLLDERLPQPAGFRSPIQGGVVFTHPKVSLDKPRIQGNTAAYGTPGAWAERIRRAPAVQGFTLELRLEILETIQKGRSEQAVSAEEEAKRLYAEAADELRQSVAKMVIATG